MSGIDDTTDEIEMGHCTTVAALVLALDRSGVMPKQAYRDVLERLRLEMPEDEALGEAGAGIERVLDLVAEPDGTDSPSRDAEQAHDAEPLGRRPINDDAVAEPRQIPLAPWLEAI